MIILLYIIQVIFIGILEILNEQTDLNTVEEPMNLMFFWFMRVKTVKYQVETDAFSNALTMLSRKILAWSVSNTYNHIKEKQML